MGLTRKLLSIQTAGLVPYNSKKVRLSKKQLEELRKQTAALEAIARKVGG